MMEKIHDFPLPCWMELIGDQASNLNNPGFDTDIYRCKAPEQVICWGKTPVDSISRARKEDFSNQNIGKNVKIQSSNMCDDVLPSQVSFYYQKLRPLLTGASMRPPKFWGPKLTICDSRTCKSHKPWEMH